MGRRQTSDWYEFPFIPHLIVVARRGLTDVHLLDGQFGVTQSSTTSSSIRPSQRWLPYSTGNSARLVRPLLCPLSIPDEH